jgi:adenine phosphoribosyltransferase
MRISTNVHWVPFITLAVAGFYDDYPKKGVRFCDILPVLRDPLAFELLITNILSHLFTHTIPALTDSSPASQGLLEPGAKPYGNRKIDAVVGLDARGFLLGPVLAQRLGCAFVPVRKAGKLPGACVQAIYEKEYGQDIFEMQHDALTPNSRVLVIDDLIATGGSAKAAGELVKKLNSTVIEYVFVVAIPFLQGAKQLDAPSYQYVPSLPHVLYRTKQQLLISSSFTPCCFNHSIALSTSTESVSNPSCSSPQWPWGRFLVLSGCTHHRHLPALTRQGAEGCILPVVCYNSGASKAQYAKVFVKSL